MINTRSWRQVVIAALLAGGSFAVAQIPPRRPFLMVSKKMSFTRFVPGGDGGLGGCDGDPRRGGYSASGGNAVDAAVAWAMRWRSRIHRPVILAAAGL
jgi:gamma-glutamyltranspeptidase/glutathione hydrolase